VVGVVDAGRGEVEVTGAGSGARSPTRRRALVALGLVLATAAGFAVARGVPGRAALRDALGDPAPDLSAVDAALRAAAAEAKVDLALLRALCAVESAGNPAVRSRAGAVGLLQLDPATAAEQARLAGIPPSFDLLDPATNARLGAGYLARLLVDFRGDEVLAVAAYNAGPATVRRWLARAADADAATVIAREGYPETRRHVERILRFLPRYGR
jgi:soluble lytic murein transglycosylase